MYKAVRLPIAYCPPISWFYLASKYACVELEAQENYQKATVRNRCRIAGPNGVQLLSIPLHKGKHQQTPIQRVQISYTEPWQRDHWRSIKTAYNNSPFLPHYEAVFEPLFMRQSETLFAFNVALIEKMRDCLCLDFEIRYSEVYACGAGTLDARPFFQKKSTGLPDYETTYYPQVFEAVHGFLPNLSALDALFCAGGIF